MYDILYVSKNQILDSDWNKFKSRFPRAIRCDNIKTFDDIRSKSFTRFFWLVWDDLEIAESFNFDYVIPKWDERYTLVFLNDKEYNGVSLISKDTVVSQKEIDHRFFMNHKEVELLVSHPKKYDIFYVADTWNFDKDRFDEFKSKYPSSQLILDAESFDLVKDKITTKMAWIVWSDINVLEDFKFDFKPSVYDTKFIHAFKNGNTYDGIFLIPSTAEISKKEWSNRFFVEKIEVDVVASEAVPFEIHHISSYDDYLKSLEQSKTEMFWVVWPDVEVLKDFVFEDYYVPYYDRFHRNITHIFMNGEHRDGICLFSRNKTVAKREFDYRFFTDKKEVDVLASTPKRYDVFSIDTFKDYEEALKKSSTEMFWIVPKEIEPLSDFEFDLYFSHHNSFDRGINHVFKNQFRKEENYNGISLMTKRKPVSSRELEFRYLIEKKEHEEVVSRNKDYDIVFISYNEPNADENFEMIKDRFPRAKRIHGVKGIHQAHIAAAELCESGMFWVVDGDAKVAEDFDFSYHVSRYERDIVHVWRSQNPINDLVYGYGGVKLLPRDLTIKMDISKPDMTTSISKKFKAMPEVSNITAFNTDGFNTWKSAFRECAKLASRIIDRQKDEETEKRLEVWCTVGEDKPFGKEALDGARAGREFGKMNKDNPQELSRINDFAWLEQEYGKRNV